MSSLRCTVFFCFFFFSSRRRHTRFDCDWSSDVCSSDLAVAPDVEYLTGHAGRRRAGGEQVRVYHVRDIHEIAGLAPIAVDRGRLTRERRGDEPRHHGGVLRLRVLTRAEHVEIAEHHGLETVRGVEGETVALARELGGRIRSERIRDMVLAVG